MKYCQNCGTQLADNASFCSGCGSSVGVAQPYAPQAPVTPQAVNNDSGLTTAAKILMIVGTVFMGLYILPLAWCIPMTVSYFKKVKNHQPISTGFKVCCLLFVSMLGGILMLCDKDN